MTVFPCPSPLNTLALAAALACALPAWAQPPSPDDTLTEVEVRERTAPGAATVLDGAALQGQRAASDDTARLLADIPGVSLYGAGGLSSLPALRGLADDRVRILIDGVDTIASCPNHMNSPLSSLDPSQVARVAVYAGIAPVSAGGDAIAGSVVVESAPPRFASAESGPLVQGEAGATWRSHGGRSAHLSASYATESLHLSVGTAQAESDNVRAGGAFKTGTATGRAGHALALDEIGSTAYDTRNHHLKLAYQGSGHLLEAQLQVQDMPLQLYPNQRMDLLDNQMARFSLRYQGQTTWGQVQAQLYRETVDHFMDFGPDKRYWYGAASMQPGSSDGQPCAPAGSATCAAGMPMRTTSQTTGARLQAEVERGPDQRLRLGAELQRYRLNDLWPASGGGMSPGTFENIDQGRRDRLGLFAEWEARLAPQWQLLLGLRADHVRLDAGTVQGYNPAGGGNQGRDAAAFNALDRQRSHTHWDWSAQARHQASPTLDLAFGLARQTRSPSLYQAYPWSTWPMAALMNNFVGDGNGYIGNPDLKPETAHTLSTTFDWHTADRRHGLQVTPYLTQVSGYIDAVQWNSASNSARTTPLVGQFTTLRYANQSARLQGVDVAGHTDLGRNAWGRWQLKGRLSHTRGSNRSTGDGLYQIMPLNAQLALTHQVGGWTGTAEWVLVAAKDRVSRVRNEVRTPGYGLLHLRGSYRWPRVRLDFGVENLFDRLYALPQGGAYLGQGSTMMASGTPWGVAVPGAGRTFYAGVNLSF